MFKSLYHPDQEVNDLNMIGRTFGGMTVESFYKTNSYGTNVYLCKCEVCGNEVARAETTLKRYPISCGCTRTGRYVPTRYRQKALEGIIDGKSGNLHTGRGIYIDKRSHMYVVRLRYRGKQCNLGSFQLLPEAQEMYDTAIQAIVENRFEEFFFSVRGYSLEWYGTMK